MLNTGRWSITRASTLTLFCFLAVVSIVRGQENEDKADKVAKSGSASPMVMRVRVVTTQPEQKMIQIDWRRGGEGLGGEVSRGIILAEDKAETIAVGNWSAWTAIDSIVGRGRGWEYPTIMVGIPAPPSTKKGAKGGKKRAESVSSTVVEFEFAENGKTFKAFSEPSPKGGSVTFAFPASKLDEKGHANPEFIANLQGLSTYARARRERLEQAFPQPATMPTQFGIVGRLAGYGEGSGRGIRHCNPEIVAEECRALRLLGMNGLMRGESIPLAEAAGKVNEFRRIYWGGSSGHPTADCPFMLDSAPDRLKESINDIHAAKATEGWAQKGDEIGVAAKEHIATCSRCAEAFRAYLRDQGVQPADVGAATWAEVKPFQLFQEGETAAAPKVASKGKGKTKGKKKGKGGNEMPAPTAAPEALRYYYTYRFMTFATAPLYRQDAVVMKQAGIPLFSMLGPTPSWGGHSLDWHEFFDQGANSAIVWETSNRDPQVWQWESYLADIARGISQRHNIPIGCLIKPHRGAPLQRMLSVVSRGVTDFEWYTYGPDYAKGDSFSQSPELLVDVGRAGRFLGQAENWLYHAHWAGKPQVAFVSPRSSEIWGKATPLGGTAFEDAKWVYLALAHAHVPVDILSEQQLAEGKLDAYKMVYVVGPNLRRDASSKLMAWVQAGGTLWTDALGLSRDEANQPAAVLSDLLPADDRKLEMWGSVQSYKAASLKELDESVVPPSAKISWQASGAWGKGQVQARIGREALNPHNGDVLATFADGKPAVARFKTGRGEVVVAGLWAGLTYSEKVRRTDFDMQADFDAAARALIAAPALDRAVYRPVVPENALVEAVFLEKEGHRSIALMNWAYRHDEAKPGRRPRDLQGIDNLRVALPGIGEANSIRSLVHGKLPINVNDNERTVVLPHLDEIDLLIVE